MAPFFRLVLPMILVASLALVTKASKSTAESYFPNLSSEEKTAYQSWLDSSSFASYTHLSFLPSTADPDMGAAVFWQIVNNEEVNFAVAVKATGWLGFGISEAGGMLGSDVVLLEAANPTELVDSYVVEGRAKPLRDDCQNWKLTGVATDGGWIIVEMNRKLDTEDTQDHVIRDDTALWGAPTRLIAAWGDQVTVGFHGLDRARNSVRLFADAEDLTISSLEALTNKLMAASDGDFDVREDNHRISTDETEYHETCRSANEIKSELGLSNQADITMIGAQAVITEETRAFVHHFTVYALDDCSSPSWSGELVYGWAPGEEGMLLPDNVGLPLFDTANRQALMIQIHYNNPGGVANQFDSSGIRFYYTNQARRFEAAVLELADPYVLLEGDKIDDGLTQYEFSCDGSCSSLFLGGGQVTVLRESLHMHQTGLRMTNEVIRNNRVVHKSQVDVFEFDQQGTFLVPQDPYVIRAGDSFKTTCYYRDGDSFGLSSQEEMCIAYLTYYPAKKVAGFPWTCAVGADECFGFCGEDVSDRNLDSEEELGRVFGSPGSVCNAVVSTLPPTNAPTPSPTPAPATVSPTNGPTSAPVVPPTPSPTKAPTKSPTKSPTKNPTGKPTPVPTTAPTPNPTFKPTAAPASASPTPTPTAASTTSPTKAPTKSPTQEPTKSPTGTPTQAPTPGPTRAPTSNPVTAPVTDSPTKGPTQPPVAPSPTETPTKLPSKVPTKSPTGKPTYRASPGPTSTSRPSSTTKSPIPPPANSTTPSPPTNSPTDAPSRSPSLAPAVGTILPPAANPTPGPASTPMASPTEAPTVKPSTRPSPDSPLTPNPTISPNATMPPPAPVTSHPSASPTMPVPATTISPSTTKLTPPPSQPLATDATRAEATTEDSSGYSIRHQGTLCMLGIASFLCLLTL